MKDPDNTLVNDLQRINKYYEQNPHLNVKPPHQPEKQAYDALKKQALDYAEIHETKMGVPEKQLAYCNTCVQMTKHKDDVCLKCQPEKQPWEERFDEAFGRFALGENNGMGKGMEKY